MLSRSITRVSSGVLTRYLIAAQGAEQYCAYSCKNYCDTDGAPGGNAEATSEAGPELVGSTASPAAAGSATASPAGTSNKVAAGPTRDANTLSSKAGDFFSVSKLMQAGSRPEGP